jgi:hypothetical protein
MDDNQTFSSDDFSELENHGLAKPVDDHGYVQVHKRRLNKYSDLEYRHLPLPCMCFFSTQLPGPFLFKTNNLQISSWFTSSKQRV